MNSFLKKVAMAVIVILSTTVASAQTAQEVVYLKNGSVIHGAIIEQIPNESLKIQTADGSVFAYKMSEVEKITKEAPVSGSSYGGLNGSSRHVQTGYRGFLDLGYTIGVGDWGEDRIELSTSHGYQINPYIFVGAGVGFNYFFDSEAFGVPVFAHVRSEFLKNAVSPFFDFKIGYSFVDADGLYFSPSVGCHFQVSNSLGLNISLGYTFQNVSYDYSYYYYDESGSENCGGISLKFGMDF